MAPRESPWVALGRVICRGCPLWWTPPPKVVAWAGWPALVPILHSSPLGISPPCPSEGVWWTSSWLSHPQVLLLGAPSTKMLMCLALERGRCCTSSLTHTKVIVPILLCFFAASSRKGRRIWLVWTHIPARPKFFSSPPLVMAPAEGKSCLVTTSWGSPTLLYERWWRGPPWLSLRCEIILGRDKYHAIPRWPQLHYPTCWCPWQCMYNCNHWL